jgi:hypothetical protein
VEETKSATSLALRPIESLLTSKGEEVATQGTMPEEAKERKITKQDVKKIFPVYYAVLEYVYSLYSDEPSIIPLKEQVGRQILFSVICILLKVEVCSCQKNIYF